MKKVLYSGMMIVCLIAVAMPVMAKGKPQKQQKPQKTEKASQQPSSATPNFLPPCQLQSPLTQQPKVILPSNAATALPQEQDSEAAEPNSAKKPNLRSNKGGKLRGQERAQYVRQLNQAKKQQRLAGQVPNACTGLPQLPPSSTTAPSTTTTSTTSTSQTSTSVEINTMK
jgi:hypothetical protein